jgi:hypothetical protein
MHINSFSSSALRVVSFTRRRLSVSVLSVGIAVAQHLCTFLLQCRAHAMHRSGRRAQSLRRCLLLLGGYRLTWHTTDTLTTIQLCPGT